jgi:hypothetical protein
VARPCDKISRYLWRAVKPSSLHGHLRLHEHPNLVSIKPAAAQREEIDGHYWIGGKALLTTIAPPAFISVLSSTGRRMCRASRLVRCGCLTGRRGGLHGVVLGGSTGCGTASKVNGRRARCESLIKEAKLWARLFVFKSRRVLSAPPETCRQRLRPCSPGLGRLAFEWRDHGVRFTRWAVDVLDSAISVVRHWS